MGPLGRAPSASSPLSLVHSPESHSSVLKCHIITSFLSAPMQRVSFFPVDLPKLFLSKEVPMKELAKIVCTVACGSVLAVGLSDQTTWAGDETTVSRSAQRIGGQAGLPYEHIKQEFASVQAGERIGGQAGQPYDHLKPAEVQPEQRVEGQDGARIGGQAGRPYDHVKHQYASVLPEDRSEGGLERAMVSSN